MKRTLRIEIFRYSRRVVVREGASTAPAVSQAQTVNSAAACLDRTDKRLNKKDLSADIADYTEASAVDPRLAKAYANRGLAQLMQSNPSAAEKDFEQCLKLDASLSFQLPNRINDIEQLISQKPRSRKKSS